MRKIAVFGVVFVAVALAVCLASCSSPSAVISFSVNGKIVHSQIVTETSGLDDFTPSLADGTFLGWFTDEACTIPFSFHDYILAGTFEDVTVYALVSHDNTGSGHPDTEEESSCEHDLQHLAAKSSTCSERGNLECWYCSLCEQYFADETCETYISPFLDRLGHETTFVPAKAATCTEDGTHEHWHCSRCGLDFEDEDCTVELTNAVISNSGHVLVYHPEEPSTCTSSGHLEYWTCSVCKDSFSSRDALEAVPLESLQKELLPHSYSVSEISQTPSATKSGSALLVCSCGETALLTLPALSAANYSIFSVPSTCTEHGSDTYTLLGAYSVQIVQEKALSPHSRGEVTDDRAPSCTESGSTGFVLCTQCGTVLSPSEPIPANGHDWAKTIVPSTCTSQGHVLSVCSACGETKREPLPLADHSFTLVPEVASTCVHEGVKSHYSCSSCSGLFYLDKTPCTEQDLALPLSSHSLDSTGTCTVCGYRELPHALFEPNSSGGVTFMGFEDGYTYPYEELVIPSSYNDLPVTEISETAFSECVKNVTALVLPDSLSSLPEGVLSVFLNHEKIESLTLPFVGASKDKGCALITLFDKDGRSNASLPESLTSVTVTACTSLCDNAFASAIYLTDIRLNEGCTEIGLKAFSSCVALENLYLPSSLQTIADDAFSHSFSKATAPTIHFAGSESQWQSIAENCDIPKASLSYKE